MASPIAGLSPPPGVAPNFTDPYTLHPFQTLTIAQCIIVTTIVVLARLYTKQYVIKKRNWEDYTCFLGWISFMVFMGIEYSISDRGGGTHQWNLYMDAVQYSRRMSNIADMVYSISLLATKLSLLLLILRVFCTVRRDLFYWLTIVLMTLNTLFYALFFFIPIFQCLPRQKIWDDKTPGHCLKVMGLYYTSAIFNTISDIAMLSVPLYLVWNLQMSLRRKIGISLIFCTGGLACIASIFRLVTTAKLSKSQDFTYVKAQCAMWAEAEIATGIICSCAVVLPRLFQETLRVVPYSDRTTAASRRIWIHMDDPSLPQESSKGGSAKVGWSESNAEQALTDAVEGTSATPKEGV